MAAAPERPPPPPPREQEPDAPELDGEDVPPTDPAPPASPVLPSAVDRPRAGSRRLIQRPEAPRIDPDRPHIIDESKRR